MTIRGSCAFHRRGAPFAALALAFCLACGSGAESPGPANLSEFATRYAAAWSSQDPDRLASFYAEDGSLVVNGASSEGRDAVRETAAQFMAAFPDMRVAMDSVAGEDGHAVFHWTWTGTNTGPGGTGRSVNLQGYEEWTFGPGGLIAVSDGHYDQSEYELQVSGEAP